MSSPQKQNIKGTSRWNFLQQAVASVESKLDTILGDEDDLTPRPPSSLQSNKGTVLPKSTPTDLSRSNSESTPNDRLQERLARAVAKKNAGRTQSPAPPSQPPSRTSTPVGLVSTDTPGNTSQTPGAIEDVEEKQETNSTNEEIQPFDINISNESSSINAVESNDQQSGLLIDPENLHLASPSPGPSTAEVSVRNSTDIRQEANPTISLRASTEIQDEKILQLQLEHESSQRELQKELDEYAEKFDALQAKLLYLSKEVAQFAKEEAASSQPGSLEQKLMERDEKIALLMAEGQNMSKNELKHLAILKKLRAQLLSDKKDHEATKMRRDKADRALQAMDDRAKKAEAARKKAELDLVTQRTSSQNVEALLNDRDTLTVTVNDLKSQLTKANERADAAEIKVQTEQLEQERKKYIELQDEYTSIKVEKELSEEKFRREIQDLKASVQREKDRNQAMETEMLGEQAILEAKLESFRARVEEVSSGDNGDIQAKLLRQIETLQSQYAAASQNWQGIEGSLLGRITGLEKERDEVVSKESELRRKIREATSKAKAAERHREEMHDKLVDAEKTRVDADSDAQRWTKKAQYLETEIARLKQDFEEERKQAEREITRLIEEEKAKWMSSSSFRRNESPNTSTRKISGLGVDMSNHSSPSLVDRANSRKALMLYGLGSNTPPKQHSFSSFRNGSNVPEPPSSVAASVDQDEYFANVPPTPASQSHKVSPRGGLSELMSNSTVGTGPSVQLVERMSANVRRLESEKAASKDEISRLTNQRDESRQEVVNLMREVEQKRKTEDRLTTLEKEHSELTARYQTTLELLGERSEQVEELKADILDVKQMYRQLADTIK